VMSILSRMRVSRRVVPISAIGEVRSAGSVDR
jgi:hypothetical protein